MARDKRFLSILAEGESPDGFRAEEVNATRKIGRIEMGMIDKIGVSDLSGGGLDPRDRATRQTNPLSDFNLPPDTRRRKF